MDIPAGKTKVICTEDVHQSDFKKDDVCYIDGYVSGADNRPYCVLVRLSDGLIDLAMTYAVIAI